MNLEVGKFRHHMKGMVSLLNLLLFVASLCFQDCSAVDTISVTKPLQDPNFIVSSNGTFKLGFFSPPNTSKRYVGLMYNDVSEMSVIWVANREKPLSDSSGVLTISEDGNLVVLNGMKEVVWSSNVQNSAPNSTAQLLEDGNLVLRATSNGIIVWESFQIPTDTFLVGMRIGRGENGTFNLTTWKSPSDPSIGNFTVGIPPLPIPELFLWNRGAISWRSGPWDGSVFIGSPQMTPTYDFRADVKNNARGAYFTYNNLNRAWLTHFKFSYLGEFQMFNITEEGDWEVTGIMQASGCNVYGTCGPNGMCDPKGSPICSCLQGFEPRDMEEWTEGNWTAGCLRKSRLQCQRNDSAAGKQGEVDGFLKLKNVKVPDQAIVVQASEQECESECIEKCSCSAYIFVVGIGCLYWEDDSMLDVEQFSIRGSDLYLRLAHTELDDTGRKQKKKAIIASTVIPGCFFLVVSLYILWNWHIKRRESMLGGSLENSKLEELPLYRYETLATASDHFHIKNKLGQGGFGSVYKGKLLDGREIAVKRLSNSSSQGIMEFMNEVTLISKLQHRNLVRLLGCCVEREEKMLVYEYLPNKSLDAYIFGSEKQDFLDWNRRCIIINGIARGLLYLHRDSRLRIIHRDLKPSNILVDEEMNPKISDFGLARIFGGNQDQANTNRIVGTYGYMAPEYAMGGKFSEKSDVYSFGVLLLEIVSGRRNTSFYHDKEHLSLLGYAWKLWNENKIVNMAFTDIIVPNVEMEIHKCVQVGLLCVQDSPNDRPSMSNVLWMLNSEIRELPLPLLPVYTATFPLPGESSDYPQRGLSNNDVSLTEVQGR